MLDKTIEELVAYPVEFARTLIQLGYEPVSPRPSKYFGRTVLVLPSGFWYIKHIRNRDGILGLYRGLASHLAGKILEDYVSRKINERWPEISSRTGNQESLTVNQRKKQDLALLARDLSRWMIVLIVTQPFHVLATRMMASFVGQEPGYGNVISGFMSIYHDSGLFGFWAGLLPRAIGEFLTFLAIRLRGHLRHRLKIPNRKVSNFKNEN